MLIVQLIGVLFGLFFAYYTYLHYKRNEFSFEVYAMWSIAWILFIILALFPSLLDPFVKSLSFSRPLDLLTVVGFLLLVGISYYTYLMTMKLNSKIEKLVRNMAIEKVKKKK